MKRVMQNWLPADKALLEMIVYSLPSPAFAQKYRCVRFGEAGGQTWPGPGQLPCVPDKSLREQVGLVPCCWGTVKEQGFLRQCRAHDPSTPGGGEGAGARCMQRPALPAWPHPIAGRTCSQPLDLLLLACRPSPQPPPALTSPPPSRPLHTQGGRAVRGPPGRRVRHGHQELRPRGPPDAVRLQDDPRPGQGPLLRLRPRVSRCVRGAHTPPAPPLPAAGARGLQLLLDPCSRAA
jgi:hypothetical protein